MKTAIPWVLVAVLLVALVAVLMGGAGGDVPPGQAASARCSGLIISGSCNVYMEQQQPTKSKTAGIGALEAAAIVVLGGAAAFGLGAWLTRDGMYEAMGG